MAKEQGRAGELAGGLERLDVRSAGPLDGAETRRRRSHSEIDCESKRKEKKQRLRRSHLKTDYFEPISVEMCLGSRFKDKLKTFKIIFINTYIKRLS